MFLSFSVVGCAGNDTSLVVDARSDYVAGLEVSAIQVYFATGGQVLTRTLATEDSLAVGVRAAERAVPEGSNEVRVTLLDPAGSALSSRSVRVEAAGLTGITVTIARACEDVTCQGAEDPAATECAGAVLPAKHRAGDALQRLVHQRPAHVLGRHVVLPLTDLAWPVRSAELAVAASVDRP